MNTPRRLVRHSILFSLLAFVAVGCGDDDSTTGTTTGTDTDSCSVTAAVGDTLIVDCPTGQSYNVFTTEAPPTDETCIVEAIEGGSRVTCGDNSFTVADSVESCSVDRLENGTVEIVCPNNDEAVTISEAPDFACVPGTDTNTLQCGAMVIELAEDNTGVACVLIGEDQLECAGETVDLVEEVICAGSIDGSVTVFGEGFIAGAIITTVGDNPVSTTTDENGDYSLEIDCGLYEIVVEFGVEVGETTVTYNPQNIGNVSVGDSAAFNIGNIELQLGYQIPDGNHDGSEIPIAIMEPDVEADCLDECIIEYRRVARVIRYEAEQIELELLTDEIDSTLQPARLAVAVEETKTPYEGDQAIEYVYEIWRFCKEAGTSELLSVNAVAPTLEYTREDQLVKMVVRDRLQVEAHTVDLALLEVDACGGTRTVLEPAIPVDIRPITEPVELVPVEETPGEITVRIDSVRSLDGSFRLDEGEQLELATDDDGTTVIAGISREESTQKVRLGSVAYTLTSARSTVFGFLATPGDVVKAIPILEGGGDILFNSIDVVIGETTVNVTLLQADEAIGSIDLVGVTWTILDGFELGDRREARIDGVAYVDVFENTLLWAVEKDGFHLFAATGVDGDTVKLLEDRYTPLSQGSLRLEYLALLRNEGLIAFVDTNTETKGDHLRIGDPADWESFRTVWTTDSPDLEFITGMTVSEDDGHIAFTVYNRETRVSTLYVYSVVAEALHTVESVPGREFRHIARFDGNSLLTFENGDDHMWYVYNLDRYEILSIDADKILGVAVLNNGVTLFTSLAPDGRAVLSFEVEGVVFPVARGIQRVLASDGANSSIWYTVRDGANNPANGLHNVSNFIE